MYAFGVYGTSVLVGNWRCNCHCWPSFRHGAIVPCAANCGLWLYSTIAVTISSTLRFLCPANTFERLRFGSRGHCRSCAALTVSSIASLVCHIVWEWLILTCMILFFAFSGCCLFSHHLFGPRMLIPISRLSLLHLLPHGIGYKKEDM
jgi:hypothetical protein